VLGGDGLLVGRSFFRRLSPLRRLSDTGVFVGRRVFDTGVGDCAQAGRLMGHWPLPRSYLFDYGEAIVCCHWVDKVLVLLQPTSQLIQICVWARPKSEKSGQNREFPNKCRDESRDRWRSKLSIKRLVHNRVASIILAAGELFQVSFWLTIEVLVECVGVAAFTLLNMIGLWERADRLGWVYILIFPEGAKCAIQRKRYWHWSGNPRFVRLPFYSPFY